MVWSGNFLNILILSPSNIENEEAVQQIVANPFGGQKGSAGVLGAGGKPSTWFPPGGLVEQDLTGVVFYVKKISGKMTRKMTKISKF